jgi:hypothetical protein
MRLLDALSTICGTMRPSGYRVHFERVEGRILASDYFPGEGEATLKEEETAWALARAFAERTKGVCVNIYVVDDRFVPVPGYQQKMIENR